MRVVVIGAGPAGLAALKVFQGLESVEELVAYEAQEEVGGTWRYTEESKSWYDSAVYDNLHTNLPPEQMMYPSMPFPEGTERFPHHTDVQNYLLAFTERFNLRRYIRLNTSVEECSFNNGVWYLRLSDGSKREADRLIIATGHFRQPHIPSDVAIDSSIQSIHSKEYRRSKPFADKAVIVAGAGTSAFDIACEISQVAKRVIISIRNLPSSTATKDNGEYNHLRPTRADGSTANLDVKSQIRRTGPQGLVEFNDGSVETGVDVILFCTGYDFHFPFLPQGGKTSPSTRLIEDGGAVYNLYREMVYIPNPTLALIGVDHKIWPFPVFEYQATLLSLYWTNQLQLPSESEMREYEVREASKWQYRPGTRSSHSFGPERQFAYLTEIYNDAVSCTMTPSIPKPVLLTIEQRQKVDEERMKRFGYKEALRALFAVR
ncbi:unnamed protein product [Aphanomyces euteiches]